jgi:hypothetical protein
VAEYADGSEPDKEAPAKLEIFRLRLINVRSNTLLYAVVCGLILDKERERERERKDRF